MFKRFFDFYRVSAPAAEKLPAEKADKQYRKLRLQAFVAATLGYSLYYVCRTSLNVMIKFSKFTVGGGNSCRCRITHARF